MVWLGTEPPTDWGFIPGSSTYRTYRRPLLRNWSRTTAVGDCLLASCGRAAAGLDLSILAAVDARLMLRCRTRRATVRWLTQQSWTVASAEQHAMPLECLEQLMKPLAGAVSRPLFPEALRSLCVAAHRLTQRAQVALRAEPR